MFGNFVAFVALEFLGFRVIVLVSIISAIFSLIFSVSRLVRRSCRSSGLRYMQMQAE